MHTNRMFKNRLRAYNAQQRTMKSQPIPPGFAVCPVRFAAGNQQLEAMQRVYAHAYELARQNVIPFYLRPVLGAVN